jgi:hypothetical protein
MNAALNRGELAEAGNSRHTMPDPHVLERPAALGRLAGLGRARPSVRRLLREPLIHFAVVALTIVCAQRVYAIRHDRFRIVITADRLNQLAESYRLQFGVEPGPQLREELVKKDFEDEVLYRQALALKLDQDDEIIRRRLIQKMQFVTQDQHAPPEPTPAQLVAYFEAHREQYRRSAAATFTHVFFSADANGDAGARSRALAALNRLTRSNALRAPTSGDIFPDNYDFSSYEPQQVTRLFGETEFSRAVFTSEVGRWGGPFRSAYGWHLLRVATRRPMTELPLEEVRDRVHGDYLQAQQESSNAAALAALLKQFQLIREDLADGQ